MAYRAPLVICLEVTGCYIGFIILLSDIVSIKRVIILMQAVSFGKCSKNDAKAPAKLTCIL